LVGAARKPAVEIIKIHVDGSYSPKVDYALDELRKALATLEMEAQSSEHSEADIVVGTPKVSKRISELVSGGKLVLSKKEESLAVSRVAGKLVLAGSDDQGLMYALLETAEQICVAGNPLDELKAISEEPQTSFRGMYIFLHNRDCEKDWFYSEEYWRQYFDLLAKSRYNSFQIVFAHQTAYLAPLFPFFIDVPEHPEVKVPGFSTEERSTNLRMLNFIAGLAEQRGLDFVVGIWEVIAWQPESHHGMKTQKSMIDGLSFDNLESYTYLALKKLLRECPGIKGIQLRANAESGVPPEMQTAFFTNTVFKAIRECDREVYLDLRGWLAHPQTIKSARSMGFPMRISMKYWAEDLGAPYQAAQQLPHYSYADFLRYPRECPISYQVWTLGSHRVFLWGDPSYVRTFCRSLKLGCGTGFEICPPLAQKGYGNEPGAWRILKEEHEYYRWEFERYWMFYGLFGRITYNPEADSEIWMRQMRRRFGNNAEGVMAIYSSASKVLNFVIRFNLSDPNMYMWPEMDTGGIMDFYLDVLPSDPALIKSFRESVREHLCGEITARMDPEEASAYLRQIGKECLGYLQILRSQLKPDDKELFSTLVDFESLAELALYHAEKILAVKKLAFYYETGDYSALRESALQLGRAAPHWKRLAEVTDGVYYENLVTGPIDSGHWKDKLSFVEEDLSRLSELCELHLKYGGAIRAFDFGGTHEVGYSYCRVPELWDFYVERGFVGVDDTCRFHPVKSEYGWVTRGQIRSIKAPLVRLSDKNLDTLSRDSMDKTGWERLKPYKNMLYSDYVYGSDPAEFMCSVPAGIYEVIVILADLREDAKDHGPMTVRINGEVLASDVTVPAGELIDLKTVVNLVRRKLAVGFEAQEGKEWIATGVVIRPVEPVIAHTPPQRVIPNTDFTIKASVTCPYPIRSVDLKVKQDGSPVHTIAMKPEEVELIYTGVIPTCLLEENSCLAYWFEAVSSKGQRSRLPELTERSTSFHLLCAEETLPPRIAHEAVVKGRPGTDIAIHATVTGERPVTSVRLHYRYTCQYYDYRVVEMDKAGDRYVAEIPGDYIAPDWDIMYYIEALDDAGSGNFHPLPCPTDSIPYHVIRIER
jgi:hypothetical protein